MRAELASAGEWLGNSAFLRRFLGNMIDIIILC